MSSTLTETSFDEVDGSTPPTPALIHERFRTVRELGAGAMGVVYQVYDTRCDRELALKVLRRRGPQALAQLKAEYRARIKVSHENLLTLHDLTVAEDTAFITMHLARGGDLLAALRAGGRGLARPREVAVQLLAGLAALHEADLLHRDVKPGNVLLDGDRVLLGDFGLLHALEEGAPYAMAGTLGYRAPELNGGAFSKASDVYALGVTLRELRAVADEPDEALDALIATMTRPAAADRPTAVDALSALTTGGASGARISLRAPVGGHAFVGRTAELAALARARAGGAPGVVHVVGPSGIGKTALVSNFLRHSAAVGDDLILRGRCLPGEHLRHRGVDGVVDAMGPCLHPASSAVASLTPTQGAALATLFPTLRPSLGAVGAARAEGEARDLRLLAWEGLRTLLDGLGRAAPVTLWIDDLQWADDDALDLLRFLLCSDEAPRVFTILSYRHEGGAGDRLDRIRPTAPSGRWPPSGRHALVDLRALSTEETRALVRVFDARVAYDDRRLEALVAEAQGLPMFAWALARGRGSLSDAPQGGARALQSRLTDTIHQSIEALPPTAQRALEVISVAEEPLPARFVAEAVGHLGAEYDLAALVRDSFVDRVEGPGAIDARYAPLHDQVRRACREHLTPHRLTELHGALGASYARHLPDEHAALAHHWAEAGHLPLAGRHAVAAGDAARARLAFGAAAQHYERALRWLPRDEVTASLARRYAEALADAGSGRRAAEAFSRAATLAAPDTDDRLALELRRSEQYFHAGDVEEGYGALRGVLGACGVSLPGSRVASITTSAALRARFLVRGDARRATPPPRAGLLLDALWTGATSLAHVNHILGDVLMLRYLHLALDLGQPSRVARALAFEAAAEVAFGASLLAGHADALFARAEAMFDRAPGQAYDRGWFSVARASAAVFRGAWREALAHVDAATAALADARERGVSWELAINHLYGLTALAMLGRADALAARHRAAWEDAAARHDPLAAHHCRSGHGATHWLFRDEPGVAREEASRALGAGRWASTPPVAAGARWPANVVSTPDYHNVVAAAQRALYEGDGARALVTVERVWPAVEAAMLLRVGFVAADLRFLRGRALVAAARDLVAVDDGWGARRRSRRLLEAASTEVAALERDRHLAARPHARMLAALVASARAPAAAARALDAVAEDYDGLAMAAHAAAARARAESLDGRPRPGGLHALAALGARAPARLAATLAPAAPARASYGAITFL